MRVGYARARQGETADPASYAALLQAEKVFVDDYGKRSQWQELLLYVQDDDTVVVQDLNDLSASSAELLEMAQVLALKHVRLISINDNVNMEESGGDFAMALLGFLGHVSGRNNEYYKTGANYITPGYIREQNATDIDWDRFRTLYRWYKAGTMTKIEMYKELGITRQQLNKILAELEQLDGEDEEK